MAPKPIKITFTLDEADVAYFQNLQRKAKREASALDPQGVIKEVRSLIEQVRALRRTPSFVREAVDTLEQLIGMLEDEDYAVPRSVAGQVVAALAYFANPEDLVPDSIPGLGFLDDAIMVKIASRDFGHELWGYKKFCSFRSAAEARPWTQVARERLPRRLVEKRKEIRAQIEHRKSAEATRWRPIW